MNPIAYILNEPFDEEVYDTFGHLSLFQNDRFHFINNNPSKLQSTDYFFTLSGKDVLSVYTDVLNTANEANIHLGVPTRKYAQGFGYDSSHVIQLATITIPRGEKELGGNTTLGQPQTYQAIISRSITETGTPFTFLDRKYATMQTSQEDYIYFTEFGMSYIEKADGVSA